MKNFIKIVLVVLFCAACSDLEDNLLSPDQDISVHKDGVKEKESSNFHGNLVKNSTDKLYNCQSCHASDYSGSKTEINCVTCHTSLPVHSGEYSKSSHKEYLKNNDVDMDKCQQCHADDYSGGVASPACSTCHTSIAVHAKGTSMISHRNYIKENDGNISNCQQCHADDYSGGDISPACSTCHSSIAVHSKGKSMISHRDYIKENGGSMDQCQQCHANDYSGGVASPACSTCHSGIAVHAEGKNMFYHIQYLKETNWQLESCEQCHGENYAGGVTSPTCLTCHSKDDGPENCSTCHFDGTIKEGNDFHKSHMTTTSFDKVACSDCHLKPTDVNDDGHLDGNPGVELTFSGIAVTVTNEPGTEGHIADLPTLSPNPVFNKIDGSCSNVYCHGYFKNGNNDNVVKFGDGFVCGSCHGDKTTGNPLPKGTHTTISACSLCHSTVDAGKNFVKPSQHINGKLNVYGQERNF